MRIEDSSKKNNVFILIKRHVFTSIFWNIRFAFFFSYNVRNWASKNPCTTLPWNLLSYLPLLSSCLQRSARDAIVLQSDVQYVLFISQECTKSLNPTPNGIVSPINLQNTNTFINAFSLFNKDVFNTGIKIVVNNMKI